MADDKMKCAPKTFRVRKGSLALMLIIAVAVAACDTAVSGPVDHECHANPGRSQGSGCEHNRG
jgi:hypothetical protein